MAFARLGLESALVQKVAQMGYTEPTPIQTAAIPHALSGRDVIGCAQTGTGKTAAFILPTLQRMSGKRGVKALVITPTRELAEQIQDVAVSCGRATRHRVVALYGGVSYRPQEIKLRNGVDIVVATPGRLLDMMGSRTVDLSGVEVLVLDEADRMLDMGFWPDVKKIMSALPAERQTMLFSATMSPKILKVIEGTLRSPVEVKIGRAATPIEAIDQTLYPVDSTQKTDLLLDLLKNSEMDRVLIFARTKRRVDTLVKKIKRTGLAADPMHSDRSQAQRQRSLNDFKNGRCRFLVATDVVARGIDVDRVSHVVNFDIPSNPEDYVHRIGRTARAGETGSAYSLYSAEDRNNLREIETLIGQEIPHTDLPGFNYLHRVLPAPGRTNAKAVRRSAPQNQRPYRSRQQRNRRPVEART